MPAAYNTSSARETHQSPSRLAGEEDVNMTEGGTMDSDSSSSKLSPSAEASVAPNVLPASSTKTSKPQGQFVTKLYAMLEAPALNEQIAWTKDGTAFCVYDPAELAANVLPRFFKHNNFQSLVRQLNIYGFHKVQNNFIPSTSSSTSKDAPAPSWEFRHASFRRGRMDLLSFVTRNAGPPKLVLASGLVQQPISDCSSGNKRGGVIDEDLMEGDTGTTGSRDGSPTSQLGSDSGEGEARGKPRMRRNTRSDEPKQFSRPNSRPSTSMHPYPAPPHANSSFPLSHGSRPSTNPYESSFNSSSSDSARRGSVSSSSFPSGAGYPQDRRVSFSDSSYPPPPSREPPNAQPYYHPSVTTHVTELHGQVSALTEALASEQRDNQRFRDVASSTFGVVFRILANLNSPGINEDLRAVEALLSQLPSSASTHQYSRPSSSQNGPGQPHLHPLHNQHQTSSARQQYQSRPSSATTSQSPYQQDGPLPPPHGNDRSPTQPPSTQRPLLPPIAHLLDGPVWRDRV